MRKCILSIAIVAACSMVTGEAQAQSLKDLLNKENVSKIVNAVTGNVGAVEMTGTWSYNGSAIEFESDNALMKAGGAAAATMAEEKLDEQLDKFGIKSGEMTFTFNADSTFTSTVGKQTLKGTYSYDASTQYVELSILKLINLNARLKYTAESMALLFKADKLLQLLTLVSGKIDSKALQTVSSIAENYDGMMLGLELKKATE